MQEPNDKPLISVLICTFNAESFIESTLESVMRQTYDNLEILILDNDSRDQTVQLIKRLAKKDKRITLFPSPRNIGPYDGLNYLLSKSKGRFIAINDHDDIWHPDKLQKQITMLVGHKEYVGCGSAILNWYEKYDTYLLRTQPKVAEVAWHTTLLFRNQGYRYDTSVLVGTDFHFIKGILCGRGRKIHNLKDALVLRRIWSNRINLSGKWLNKTGIIDIMKTSMNIVDKLLLINRKLIPEPLVDFLFLKIIMRSVTLQRKDIDLFPQYREMINMDTNRSTS